MRKYYGKNYLADAEGMFDVDCSAGRVNPFDNEKITYENGERSFTAVCEKDGFTIKSEICEENGVYVRRDSFTNTGSRDITLYKYLCGFKLEGGLTSVYTQHNGWCGESLGKWQELVSEISVKNEGHRLTDGGAPYAAIYSENSGMGRAFNLVAGSGWIMRISKMTEAGKNYVSLKAGMNDSALNLTVYAGETVTMPEIIFYDFKDKTEMNAHKLHEYVNKAMPRKTLPVIFNTWFVNFDNVTAELILSQAEKAAYLGAEYFVIDAGWFGNGDAWSSQIGEWYENTKGALCGKMAEIAEKVRSCGMKFGLWLEPERALDTAKISSEHPEYFFGEKGQRFLDFTNPAAAEYIKNVIFGLIDKYGIEFLKFDFNASAHYAPQRDAHYRYYMAHKKLIEEIRGKYPGIYIENCASGGMRCELGQMKLFDGVWFSDNQNPYDGMRIYRDTLLRMPTSMIEKWGVFATNNGFVSKYQRQGEHDRFMTVTGPTWDTAAVIDIEYMKQFLSFGAIGITCNLDMVNDGAREALKAHIKEFKQNREFYRTCITRIIAATDEITVLQYSDVQYKRNIIAIYCENAKQTDYTLYPRLNHEKVYVYANEEAGGKELCENGIRLNISNPQKCCMLEIKERD